MISLYRIHHIRQTYIFIGIQVWFHGIHLLYYPRKDDLKLTPVLSTKNVKRGIKHSLEPKESIATVHMSSFLNHLPASAAFRKFPLERLVLKIYGCVTQDHPNLTHRLPGKLCKLVPSTAFYICLSCASIVFHYISLLKSFAFNKK